MLEAYKTNTLLRERYLRMNGITYAEIWDTDDGYRVSLCSDDGKGWPEGPEHYTIGQATAWLRNTCNCKELELRG